MVNCKKCGNELPDDSVFCNKCGSKWTNEYYQYWLEEYKEKPIH